MNKLNRTYINILCIIFIIVLLASILVPSAIFSTAFFSGLSDGLSQKTPAEEVTTVSGVPIEVTLDTFSLKNAITDSIRGDNGETIPIEIHRATLRVPSNKYPLGAMIIVSLSYIAIAILFVMVVIQLIKFSVKVNKGTIFDPRNASHLNKVGIFMIILSICQIIPGIIEDSIITNLNLSYHGLGFTSYWTIPWGEFLLGILALLMAQIWTRGIQLKEDQEFTI